MSFIAGAIEGPLILNTSGFTGGLSAAISAATSGGPGIAAPLLAAADLAIKAFGAVKDAIVEAVRGAAKEFDDIGEASERAGVSTEFLSSMGRMAKDAGSSVEGLGDALKFLNKNMAAAAEGDDGAVKAFARIGISQKEVAEGAGDTEGMFRRVVDAVKDLDTTSAKTHVTMELMGRGGSDMLPFINQGTQGMDKWRARIDGLGATVTKEMAEGGDSFKRLGGLWDTMWDGIRNTVAQPILAAIGSDSKDLESTIAKISMIIREYVPPALKIVSTIVQVILTQADFLISQLALAAKLSDAIGITDHASRDLQQGHEAIATGQKLLQKIDVNINAAMDAKDASSQIAAKLQPELARVSETQTRNWEGSARRAALVASKTGGKAGS